MKNSKILNVYLILSGILLSFIGGSTLIAPIAMKGSAGIDLYGDTNLLNDTRSYAALLLSMGGLALIGLFNNRLTYTSALASSLTLTSLGIGRSISMIMDGMPVDGLVKATGVEMVLGLAGWVLAIAYQKRLKVSTSMMQWGAVLILMVTGGTAYAQKTDKKIIQFSMERVIPVSAEKVWKVVGEDFGAIANSHPKIVSSSYNQGHITGGENATRICHFNESGSQYIKEKQISFDAENYTFKVLIYQSGGIPIDTDYSYGIYTVIPIDGKHSKLVMEMGLRTKPAFMGAIAKGQFKKDIANYLIAVEHHVTTGENVNKDNFKTIKKQYANR